VSGWRTWLPSLQGLPSTALPFTLGEAVDEYCDWAGDASLTASAHKGNQRWLVRDLEEGLSDQGSESGDVMRSLVAVMTELTVRDEISSVATEILDVWRRADTVRATFRDLCDPQHHAFGERPDMAARMALLAQNSEQTARRPHSRKWERAVR
jgi:hypothetical protein